MALLRRVGGFLLLRSLVRELRGIRQELAAQRGLLVRLAEAVAPMPPPVDPDLVAADTGLSYSDAIDQAIVLDYVERTVRDTGHQPTEDEILIHLADEKTRDLHTRLVERERDLERLAADRRPR